MTPPVAPVPVAQPAALVPVAQPAAPVPVAQPVAPLDLLGPQQRLAPGVVSFVPPCTVADATDVSLEPPDLPQSPKTSMETSAICNYGFPVN